MQNRILQHIAFWLGYVLFKSYLNIDPAQDQITFSAVSSLVVVQSVFLPVKVPMVYTLFYITGKYLSRNWPFFKTALAVILLFAGSTFLYILIRQFIVLGQLYGLSVTLAMGMNMSSVVSSFFILCFTCSAALTIKLIRTTIKQKELEQELIRKKLETELQYLKAQTNPHFLFNTLNNIYGLARKKSGYTAEAVMKLSKLLRFMLYESQQKTITIDQEVQILRDYIELEKIRYGDKLDLEFTKLVDDGQQRIAPLILLPFVENAFKHGASESRFKAFIRIDLKLSKGLLGFEIENSIGDAQHQTEYAENIGLTNVRRQLELLYPGHQLQIENTHNRFRVSLTINLQKG